MGDHEHRHAFGTEVGGELQNSLDGFGVQRRGRLVEEYDLRCHCQCTRDRDPLLLSAGQGAGARSGLVPQANSVQLSQGQLAGGVGGEPPHPPGRTARYRRTRAPPTRPTSRPTPSRWSRQAGQAFRGAYRNRPTGESITVTVSIDGRPALSEANYSARDGSPRTSPVPARSGPGRTRLTSSGAVNTLRRKSSASMVWAIM